MPLITPDIIAHVRFYTTSEGGRQGPTPHGNFGCLFECNGECFDCRLLLDEVGALRPGQQAKVPIKFLAPDLLKNRIQCGQKFHLREVRTIAEGHIDQIFFEVPVHTSQRQ